jgi:hypothetical protein
MTVLENVTAGAFVSAADDSIARRMAGTALDRVGLGARANALAGRLTNRPPTICCVTTIADPRLLSNPLSCRIYPVGNRRRLSIRCNVLGESRTVTAQALSSFLRRSDQFVDRDEFLPGRICRNVIEWHDNLKNRYAADLLSDGQEICKIAIRVLAETR